MFQSLYHLFHGRLVTLNDGRVSGFSQPEPEFMLRRYEHAQALREIKREARIRELVDNESRGVVERIRIAFGIA